MTFRLKYFRSNIESGFSDAFTHSNFSDVTLVSDDKIPFQAHRYVLSASSPVMKNILLNNPDSHPVIFLRGVNHRELASILQFIYLGEVSISTHSFGRFLDAAKDLQIKQVYDTMMITNKIKGKNGVCNQGDRSDQDDDNANDVDQTIHEYVGEKIMAPAISRVEQILMCKECQATFKTKGGLLRHIKSKHEGVLYSCHHCDYKATQRGHLKHHQESVHEGMKYSCNNCDYEVTSKMGLLYHTRSKHYGIVYTCQYCDYEAKQRNHLKNHEESIHEGVKYSCNECDFKGTRKTSLKAHKQTKHFIK